MTSSSMFPLSSSFMLLFSSGLLNAVCSTNLFVRCPKGVMRLPTSVDEEDLSFVAGVKLNVSKSDLSYCLIGVSKEPASESSS